MANELTRFFNPETGGFGLQRLEEARKAGLSDQRIRELLPGSGIVALPERAAAALGMGSFNNSGSTPVPQAPPPPPAEPAWKPSSTNELTRFLNPETGGFGLARLEEARKAGFTDAQIRRLLPGSGASAAGYRAVNALGLGSGTEGLSGSQLYERSFQASLNDYQESLKQQVSQYQQQAETRNQELQTQLFTAKAERDDAKAKAEEYEKQKKAEQEMAVSEQLSSLRSGSTVSGSAGPGLGSLSSGRSSYSVSTGGRQGGVLDRAYKDIDPTDSVLNKDVAIEAAGASSGGSGGGSRTEARRRALAAGGNASSYYSRRFG
jgi:DNA-binding transcriptional MerR regulator